MAAVARERSTRESLDLWGQPPGAEPFFNYRWEHLLAVERIAEELGRQLGADMEVLRAAVWLHDVVKSHAVKQPDVSDAELAAEEARRVLEQTDFPASKTPAVCEAIRLHEGLHKEENLGEGEAGILWDADKLAKLGATHLVHNLCIRPAFDPRFAGQPTTTDLVVHSLDEWLALGERIVASMNTRPGKLEAARRLDFLRDFAKELRAEWEWKS